MCRPVERVHRVDQAHGERRARAEPRPRRQIAVVVDLEALVHVQPFEHAANRRVLDLADLLDVLDDRVDDAELVIEERRQLANADVAVLVDGRRQHGAAMLAIPVRVVGAAAEERDAERRAADDHLVTKEYQGI